MEDDKEMIEDDVIKYEEVIKDEEVLEEDLTQQQKGIPPEIEKMIKTKISQMSNGVFSEEEQEEIYDEISQNEVLLNKEKGTLDIYLNNEIKRIIREKLINKNKDNPMAMEEELEKQKKDEEKEEKEKEIEEDSENLDEDNLDEELEEDSEKEEEVGLEDEKEEKTDDIPQDVKEACQKLGINKIRGYFYVNASDLGNKVDNTMVNKFGNRVLMLEVPSEKLEGPNKYYGMQDNRMVVYGNEDQAVREVTGNVTKMGKVVEPLKLQEPKEVKFDNKDGMVVNERLDDNMELSVQEANNYREEMEKLLEKYSREVELLKEDDDMELNEKLEKMRQNDGEFFSQANSIAQKYDISIDDRENIQTKVIENSVEAAKDETEEYEERDLNEKQAKEDDEYDGFDEVGRRVRPR